MFVVVARTVCSVGPWTETGHHALRQKLLIPVPSCAGLVPTEYKQASQHIKLCNMIVNQMCIYFWHFVFFSFSFFLFYILLRQLNL